MKNLILTTAIACTLALPSHARSEINPPDFQSPPRPAADDGGSNVGAGLIIGLIALGFFVYLEEREEQSNSMTGTTTDDNLNSD